MLYGGRLTCLYARTGDQERPIGYKGGQFSPIQLRTGW